MHTYVFSLLRFCCAWSVIIEEMSCNPKPLENRTTKKSWHKDVHRMEEKMKKWMIVLLTLAVILQSAACGQTPVPPAPETSSSQQETSAPAREEETVEAAADPEALPAVGEELSGFTVQGMEPYEPLKAEILWFTHEKSGAQLCYIKNDDTNRAFSIAYRTPHVDETDANHVFEHAIVASSEKYPSKDLFFDLAGKTYNTYVNAFTYLPFTLYPVSSQSEEQLRLMADAYLSCMVSPDLLQDKRFFQREALRYMLYDVEEPIAMGGTVFSEDMGYMTNIGTEALRNLFQALYPGEYAANFNGRAHVNYRDLTFEHMEETFARSYSFDNSLLLLYGDLDYRSFLEFIDGEYLSKAEKRGTDLSMYDDPVAEPGYVEEVAYAPAYEGDSTEDASTIYYAMDLDGQDWETLMQYDLFGAMLGSDSSIFHENLKAAGLAAPAFVELVLQGEKPVFCFGMVSANQEDAKAFKDAVDSTLLDVAQNGLDKDLVETVLKTKALGDYTAMESADLIIENVFPSICLKWAQTGEADMLIQQEEAFLAMQQDTQQTQNRKLAAALQSAPHSAMVTTIPQPGLAEQIVAEQEEYLAEMKAAMTPEELEQMVEDTLAFDEWNASENSNQAIVIPVEELPEPEPTPEFAKEEADGAVYYTAASEMEQISLHRVYFDSSAVPQEDLHYISLYSILLHELAAENYSKTQKDNLMAQYLYDFNVDTIYPEDGEYQYPMLYMDWNCMAEDYETSLQLLLEIMGGLKLDDKDEMIRVLDKYLPILDGARGDAFALAQSLANAGVDRSEEYGQYISGQHFYTFAKKLRERLDNDPGVMEEIAAKFDSLQELILHKDRMVVMNIAPQGELEQISAISRRILGELPSRPEVKADYDLPKYPDRIGVIVEGANYNTFSVSDAALADSLSGSFFPFVMALSDRYIVPKIRFQGLAYSAAMSHNHDLDSIYTYSYSDPKVSDTVAIIEREADVLADMELTQEDLDGYILSSYSYVTYPMGNLNKYLYAMNQDLKGFDVENWRRLAAEIKTATLNDQEQAADTLRSLLENQHLVTVGNAELLQAEADTFRQVYDYRKPLEEIMDK